MSKNDASNPIEWGLHQNNVEDMFNASGNKNQNSMDKQYSALIKDILDNGYFDSNRTADKSLKVFGKVLRFDLRKEFPMLSLKFTGIKTLTKEMLWIYQQGSNDVTWLQERNVKIWNEWANEDNTVGKSYGYQISKFNQVQRLIEGLKNDPQSRRHVIDLWNYADLDEMALAPCMFLSVWDVNDGYLNVHVTIRSSDTALGLPYNIAQMSVLAHMIAQVSGLKAGEMMFTITNAHLYEQHIEPIKEIFNRESYPAPKLYINPDVKDFYDFTADDVKLVNYKYHPFIKMRVSV